MLIKPKAYSIPSVIVGTHDTPELISEVNNAIAKGTLPENSIIILDFVDKPEHYLDLLTLKRELKKIGVYIAGLRNVNNQTTLTKAHVAGIGLLVDTEAAVSSLNALETIVVHKNHRSGQQSYYRDKNVVLIGNVSSGAEIIADGSITVFGTANGKLLAGAGGLNDAFIITSKTNPELIAINGTFMTSESISDEVRNRQTIITKHRSQLNIVEITHA